MKNLSVVHSIQLNKHPLYSRLRRGLSASAPQLSYDKMIPNKVIVLHLPQNT